jgi:hypothetical protein
MWTARARGDDAAVTSHPQAATWRRPPPRRAFLVGFLAGFPVTVPATILALLLPLGERLQPFLTPGVAMLRPLSSAMPGWPGGVNMLFAALANGLVVACSWPPSPSSCAGAGQQRSV